MVQAGPRPATECRPCKPGPASQGARAAQTPARPKLAVLLIFDQLRGDYLEKWRPVLGAGGFRRLLEQGTSFRNCHYPYADTVTGAGHASVATGCSPDIHGVIGNTWYDRASRRSVSCSASERYSPVPPRPPSTTDEEGRTKIKAPLGGTPEQLLAPTLADALKDATDGKAHVVSLSFKDRSAVLPGGKRPDACYWFDVPTGRFETSTYYRDALHSWVADLNKSGRIDRWQGVEWTRLRSDLDYSELAGPDHVPGESTGYAQGRTFPHPTGGLPLSPRIYYEALYNSPFGNDLLLDLVLRAIEAERLGHHEVPDLLCVSFSSNDAVGHAWGPDSQEVLDVTLRTDRQVARLLDFLDTTVGKDNYVVAVTSDHGVCPLPEVSRSQGKDAGRISAALLKRRAEDFLRETFGGERKERWIEVVTEQWAYLNADTIAHHKKSPAQVQEALAGWLKEQPWVEAAYTRAELTGSEPPGGAIASRVLRSFHRERSGDVTVVTKPYYLITSYLTGTNHGSPHPYDTHVPLIFFGPGVRPGSSREEVTPQVAAVALAHLVGIRPPAKATASLPRGLLQER